MAETAPVCAVVGVGPGNGEALARRFSADGYAVALMARRPDLTMKLAEELPRAKAYGCDVADAASVETAFGGVLADLGEIEVIRPTAQILAELALGKRAELAAEIADIRIVDVAGYDIADGIAVDPPPQPVGGSANFGEGFAARLE